VFVPESSIVRICKHSEIVSEIIPELWMFRRYGLNLKGPYSSRTHEQMTVTSKKGKSKKDE